MHRNKTKEDNQVKDAKKAQVNAEGTVDAQKAVKSGMLKEGDGEDEDNEEELKVVAGAKMLVPDAFFSPNIKPMLANLIAEEQESIESACYQFTLFDLAQLMVENVQKKQLRSELVVDDVLDYFKNDPKNYIAMSYALIWLKLNGIPVSACDIRNKKREEFGGFGNMHHKFFIFGKNGKTKKPLLLTGSFNCTGQADVRNWENAVILDVPEVINKFRDHYKILPRTG